MNSFEMCLMPILWYCYQSKVTRDDAAMLCGEIIATVMGTIDDDDIRYVLADLSATMVDDIWDGRITGFGVVLPLRDDSRFRPSWWRRQLIKLANL